MAYPMTNYKYLAIYAKNSTFVPIIQLVPINILNSSGITEVALLSFGGISTIYKNKWTFDFTNNTISCDLAAAASLKVWGIK